ncbi:MAG TPA: hypothetical protein VF598_10360, partial [Hymenobacter sp.]
NVISSGIRSVFVQGIDTTGTNTVPSQFFTKYDFNSYHRTAGTAQALLGWRPPTGTVTYTSLPNIRTALGFETNGIDVAGGADPFFVDLAGGNYNIRSTSTAAYRNGTALPADVAAAIGVPASAGQNRGALIWPGKP